MQNWYLALFIFYTFIHLIILLLLLHKPRLFFPVSAILIIVTSSIELYERQFGGIYSIAVILIAITILLLSNKVRLIQKKLKPWDKVHRCVFLLMMVYFAFQALRGILFYETIGASYGAVYGWFFYFIIIGIFAFVLTHNNLPKTDKTSLSLYTIISISLFLIVYIIGGFYVEKALGRARDLQHILTSDTTQIAFLLTFAFPSAIILLKNKNPKRFHKIVVISLFIIAFIFTISYSSKLAMLIIVSFVIATPFILPLSKVKWWLFIPLIAIILNFKYWTSIPNVVILDVGSIFNWGTLPNATDQDKIDTLFNTNTGITRNSDRLGKIKLSISFITKDPTSLLFGYGINSYKHKLSSSFAPAWAVVLLDTGLIGFMLLITNFVLVSKRIIIQKDNSEKAVLMISVMITVVFLFAGQSLTNTLFYFMFMPNGLLAQLCGPPSKQRDDETVLYAQ